MGDINIVYIFEGELMAPNFGRFALISGIDTLMRWWGLSERQTEMAASEQDSSPFPRTQDGSENELRRLIIDRKSVV